jgi:RimJ/RimL family protein N-acetyltransferase
MNMYAYIMEPLAQKHAEPYFHFIERNRERISRYFPRTIAATTSLPSTIEHIADRIKAAERKEIITHLVREKDSGNIVAAIFLKDIDFQAGKAEVGFFIDERLQGRGITTHFVSEVCAFGFNTLGLEKLFMRIAETNNGSKRVAEKNGFSKMGILKKDFRIPNGELIDLIYFERSRHQNA